MPSVRPNLVLVTGSSRGIGAAIALRLAAHGADVVINYVASSDKAEGVARQAREEHHVRAMTIQADVSDDREVASLFEETKKVLGRIDIVMVFHPFTRVPPRFRGA